MSPKPTTPGVRPLLIPAGGVSIILGTLALTGWLFHMPGFTRAGPAFNPMVVNAAVGFVLDGLALILLAGGRRRFALPGAAWSLVAGVLTLLEYGLSIDLGFDQMLAVDRISQSAHPGRLAPNTAVCFVLCGLALWCAARARPSGRSAAIIGVLGAVVMAIGAASVFGYLAGYPTYAWGQWTQMAANTATGFVVLGLGIVAAASLADRGDTDPFPRWQSIATTCAGLTVTLSFTYGFARDVQSDMDRIFTLGKQFGENFPTAAVLALRENDVFMMAVAVVIGILGSVVLGCLVDLTLTSRRRAQDLQSANERLEQEIFVRKRTEEKLLTSEVRFRTAFEQAPYGMCLSAVDGRLLLVSRAFCEILGRSERDLLNSNWSELTHPEDVGVSQTAMVRLLTGQASSIELEKRYIGGRGNVIWARLKISMLRDRAGKPAHFVTHIEDATARKAAELALRQREERFRQAFEYAPFGLALIARDGRILQVNATVCRMLGYSAEELIGAALGQGQPPRRCSSLAGSDDQAGT